MYDEGMDYRNDSANRSDNLENEARYIHFINPPSIFCTERGTQLKKQSVALSAGVFFQNHHRREPTAIIASLASMLLHIHNYIIQHSISFVKYFHTKSKIGYRSPTVRGSRFLYKSKCKTMRNDTWVVPYKAFHKIPI